MSRDKKITDSKLDFQGAPSVPSGRSVFVRSYNKFDDSFEQAVRFSDAVGELRVKKRFSWASYLYAKMTAIGFSIIKICDIKSLDSDATALDHSSICALSRNLFEASIMFLYLAQRGISEEQWTLRRDVIVLHDTISRYKIFKHWRYNSEAQEFRDQLTELRANVSSSKIFANLDEDRRKKILGGSEIYVNGLRGAAKSAGWDKDDFEAIYTYLSQHSHSAPVSFLRMDDHGVDYEKPSEAQFGISALAIEVADACFRMCNRRVAEIYHDRVPAHDFEDFEPDTESPLFLLPSEISSD